MSKSVDFIEFILNGEYRKFRFNASSDMSPLKSLLYYLRNEGYKGVKEGCGEGDCGACTVVVGEIVDNQISYYAINSCLVLLPMIHGKHIITIEYLKDNNELHPVQQAIVDNNASQCGFCTPGISMSLLALYKSDIKIDNASIRKSLAGNLCRCTGYNTILKAGQIATRNIKPDKLSVYEDEVLTQLNKINKKELILLKSDDCNYLIPFNLQEVFRLKDLFKDSVFLNGATEIGLAVSKKNYSPEVIIDISQLPELKQIIVNDKDIKIGSTASINKIMDNVETNYQAFYSILGKFGSDQIRNLASLGGNIGAASPIGDTIPVLMAYGASVILQSKKGEREELLEDFIIGYRKTTIRIEDVIKLIRIAKPQKEIIIKSYKISRREDLDISTLSVAFRLRLVDGFVKDISIYFGGMAEMVVRARKTEDYLRNKKWDYDIINKAKEILKDEFIPISDARAEKEGRNLFIANLLLKFWSETYV